MHNLNYQSATSNYTGMSNVPVTITTPPVQGLHEGLATILQRLAQANSLLDVTLQRVHGPRPMATAEQLKNTETPCVTALAGRIESELNTLETLANQICNFIG